MKSVGDSVTLLEYPLQVLAGTETSEMLKMEAEVAPAIGLS
jgi:hypothetical protein